MFPIKMSCSLTLASQFHGGHYALSLSLNLMIQSQSQCAVWWSLGQRGRLGHIGTGKKWNLQNEISHGHVLQILLQFAQGNFDSMRMLLNCQLIVPALRWWPPCCLAVCAVPCPRHSLLCSPSRQSDRNSRWKICQTVHFNLFIPI